MKLEEGTTQPHALLRSAGSRSARTARLAVLFWAPQTTTHARPTAGAATRLGSLATANLRAQLPAERFLLFAAHAANAQRRSSSVQSRLPMVNGRPLGTRPLFRTAHAYTQNSPLRHALTILGKARRETAGLEMIAAIPGRTRRPNDAALINRLAALLQSALALFSRYCPSSAMRRFSRHPGVATAAPRTLPQLSSTLPPRRQPEAPNTPKADFSKMKRKASRPTCWRGAALTCVTLRRCSVRGLHR